MRTFGVEEELLLVEEGTGHPVPLAAQVIAAHRAGRAGGDERITAEMQQEMLEVVTRPHADAFALAAEIHSNRGAADHAAQKVGARAAALATSPFPVDPHVTPSPRYQEMKGRFGALARHSLTCGLHVHVSIRGRDEGVAVLDRIRPWLPVLLALTANSPFAEGEDTGHASWRTIAWHQWPVAGPNPIFGSVERYDDHERRLLASGVVLDAGMLYFAARLSRAHPTVEVRIADVPLDAAVSTAVAALVRALVDTAAEEWRAGVPVSDEPECLLRLATWQAALRGVHGPLVDPRTCRFADGPTVVMRLLEHVAAALERAGDEELVRAVIGVTLEDGTGADVQRASADDLSEVVRAAVRSTHRFAATSTDPLQRWREAC